MSPRVGLDQTSLCTMLISAPTIFFAKAGIRSLGCHWSMTTVMPPGASGSIVTSTLVTRWKVQTSSRKAGSASIAATASRGAS